MIFLGIASLLQAAFLPGFLVLRLLGLCGRCSTSGTLVLAFGLSLIFNHFLVWTLVTFGLFIQSVVLAIFGLEMLLFLLVLGPALMGYYDLSASKYRLYTWLAEFFRQESTPQRIVDWIAVVLALFFCLFYLRLFGQSLKVPFQEWDVVNVWTKWADVWFSGEVPLARSYPQLIPMNWAISYAFVGSDLMQVFPKMLMGMFPVYILLTIVFLARATKESGYSYALVGSAILLNQYSWFLTSGHVDIPVAFFGLLSVSCLVAARSNHYAAQWEKFLLLGGIFAAGAALTKQSGFFIVLLYPALAYLLIFKDKNRGNVRKAAWFTAWLVAGFCLMLAPWYMSRIFTRENFELVSVAGSGVGPQAGLDWVDRIKLVYLRDLQGLPFVIMCVALFNTHVIWRPLVWLVAVPWLLINPLNLSNPSSSG